MTRRVTSLRRGDPEAGASLVLALIMIVVIAVAIVATLAYASTSLHTVSVIKAQRQTLYAADGAVQTAIQIARKDGDAGAVEGNCGSLQGGLQYPSVGDQPPVSVSCEVVGARGIGVPGVDYPPYTILTTGGGIDAGASSGLVVGGSISSGAGIAGSGLDLTGYSAVASGSCSGIIVSDPTDLMCPGSSAPDPAYPHEALPELSDPNPDPSCTSSSGVLQFEPGYYTHVEMFENPDWSGCRPGFIYLKPGVYYFDFGFDWPDSPGTTWHVTSTVIGGTAKGWNPDSSTPQSLANGTGGKPKNCDDKSAGVQLVFGGESQMVLASSAAQVELCADATPSNTTQHLALYGLGPEPGTGTPTQQTATRRPTSTSHLTPAAGWTGIAPQNNLLPIAPNPSPIDDQLAAVTLPAVPAGSKASIDVDGFPAGAPGGSVRKTFTLKVAHREIAAADSDVADLRVQVGSGCEIPVPLRRSPPPPAVPAPVVVDTFTSASFPCLVDAVRNNFSVTFSAEAAANRAFTENLDGIELDAVFTPPVLEAQKGCVLAGCPMLDVGGNGSGFALWGTLYAPRASVAARFGGGHPFEFRRGVVARTVVTSGTPSGDSSPSFCLGYGTPCVGPSRVLRLTATVDGTIQLVALVQVFDSPAVGRAVSVLSWDLKRS